MKIDIILPIYNSPNEVRACIESIIEVTPKDEYTLYLLDDCSTDSEIRNITKHFSSTHDNIISYRNEQNKGFSENVNNGFRMTTNDIIILNSDTIVTHGWLQGLYSASVSQPKVGAVGPLSNYGMVTSVPSIYQKINDSIKISKITDFLRNNSRKIYPETPILIGFCMYITRKALNEVGFFDAETFKKGYGEEIDWCLRTREKGYKLLIADDTYVFHIGGVSFGEEKILLQRKNTEIINSRFPNYVNEVRKFEISHPLTNLRKRMSKMLGVPVRYRIKYSLRRQKQILRSLL